MYKRQREHMTLPFERNIKCSNYVGETIDMAVDMGVKMCIRDRCARYGKDFFTCSGMAVKSPRLL